MDTQGLKQFMLFVEEISKDAAVRWDTPIAPGKWSIAEIVSHIWLWDQYSLHLMLPLMREGVTLRFIDQAAINSNAESFARAGMHRDELIRAWKETRNELITRCKSIPDDLTFYVGRKKHNIETYVQTFIVSHDIHHMDQIKDYIRMSRPLAQRESSEPIFGVRDDRFDYKERDGCYAVILDANRQQVAAIVTQKGNWFLPGGGFEAGETPEQCHRRELLEETGFRINIDAFIGKAKAYFISPQNEPIASNGQFFLAQFIEKAIEPIEDDHELRWINVKEADRLLFHPHHSWAVREAIAKMSQI